MPWIYTDVISSRAHSLMQCLLCACIRSSIYRTQIVFLILIQVFYLWYRSFMFNTGIQELIKDPLERCSYGLNLDSELVKVGLKPMETFALNIDTRLPYYTFTSDRNIRYLCIPTTGGPLPKDFYTMYERIKRASKLEIDQLFLTLLNGTWILIQVYLKLIQVHALSSRYTWSSSRYTHPHPGILEAHKICNWFGICATNARLPKIHDFVLLHLYLKRSCRRP